MWRSRSRLLSRRRNWPNESLPRGVHINVQEGERVRAGEPLMDGPRKPHDILAVLGEKELQKYLVNEIQEVYRLQGVNINDKHLEVISRQMMRWVKVDNIGDSEFLPEEVVDRFRFREENARVEAAVGVAGVGRPVFLGITKASLSTDCRDQRQDRLLARTQGERDHGSPDPCRNRYGILSRREDRGRGCGGNEEPWATLTSFQSHTNKKRTLSRVRFLYE